MEDLREKLKGEIEKADWNMLIPHHEKETVFLLASDLDLVGAGVAIAEDNSQLVSMWLKDKKLARPTDEQVENFKKDEYKKLFNFLIIQPYVIIQLIKSDELS